MCSIFLYIAFALFLRFLFISVQVDAPYLSTDCIHWLMIFVLRYSEVDHYFGFMVVCFKSYISRFCVQFNQHPLQFVFIFWYCHQFLFRPCPISWTRPLMQALIEFKQIGVGLSDSSLDFYQFCAFVELDNGFSISVYLLKSIYIAGQFGC